MDAIIIPRSQFKELISSVEEIKTKLNQKKEPNEAILDNQQFLMMMNISKRTAQAWRNQGLISYSMVGSKIFYKMADINEMLKKNYVRARMKD
jgi:hypothetical protein